MNDAYHVAVVTVHAAANGIFVILPLTAVMFPVPVFTIELLLRCIVQ